MRRIPFLFFTFAPLFALTQGKEFYQLQKNELYYTEDNHFFRDSIWRFHQTITYNKPNVFDEENWTRLEIQIKDTAKFRRRRTLDLSDISAVRCYFTTWNVWEHFQDITSITGQVQLLSVTPEGISLKLNLTVTNLNTKDRFIYAGERIFSKFYKISTISNFKKLSDSNFLNHKPSFKDSYNFTE
jgi:hypothetical protein